MLLIPALDDVVPKGIPYVIRGAIIRGIRGIVASVISFGTVGLANGTILAGLHISPEYSVIVAATVTPGLLALDKYLRERGYQESTDVIDEPDIGPLPDEEEPVPEEDEPTDEHPNP